MKLEDIREQNRQSACQSADCQTVPNKGMCRNWGRPKMVFGLLVFVLNCLEKGARKKAVLMGRRILGEQGLSRGAGLGERAGEQPQNECSKTCCSQGLLQDPGSGCCFQDSKMSHSQMAYREETQFRDCCTCLLGLLK